MAKQRVVNTYFWSDDFILDLKADEKLLFLYVLTNPQTDLCGAYQIAMQKMVFETRLSEKRILAILDKFELAGKVMYRKGWVIVRNFAKHQVSNPKVSKGIERSLNTCPDWVKQVLKIGFDSLSAKSTPEPELLLEPELEPVGEEAASPPAPAPDTIVIFPSSKWDNPAVILFEEKFGIKVGTNFALAISSQVQDFGIWESLLTNKQAYADRPLDERKKMCNWILDEYEKRVKEKQNGQPIRNFREQRTDEKIADRSIVDAARQRIADRKLSGPDASDSVGQLRIVGTEPDNGRKSLTG